MGYILNERLEVSIFINDNEYPLDRLNLLNSLHIGTSVRGSVPLLSFQITDVQRALDQIGLIDGSPIRVVIKPNGQQTRTYNFRHFNHVRPQGGASFIWTIYAYYDNPLYWNSTTSVGIRGTSNDVLSEIAKTCGLQYDGTASNDNQLWMPNNQNYRSWAKSICDLGYVDDTSCMVLGLDLDGTLRYKNVNKLPTPTKNVVAYQKQANAYTAVDMQLSTSSGFNNAVTGYQNLRMAQSSIGDTTQTALSDLSFTSDSKTPLYNQQLKAKLNRGPVRFGPIDVGNSHENYERSSYQNLRYRNLYSFGLELLIQDLTNFQLMEQFTFSVQKEDTSIDNVNSGVYKISGHSLYIQGSNYFEKLGIVRNGTNERT